MSIRLHSGRAALLRERRGRTDGLARFLAEENHYRDQNVAPSIWRLTKSIFGFTILSHRSHGAEGRGE
ncbi:MAG: hypothetical protein C3F11_20580 [Methylocystaceae bacterium]|nr:MAG: hypothetical protein C3F11_20580 [Methylocystaceae bacterium]